MNENQMKEASGSQHPNGLFVGCLGINHVTFGYGVDGRVERILSVDNRTDFITNGKVTSVLINPEPINTGTELKMCNVDGTLVADEIGGDDIPRRLPFVPDITRIRYVYGISLSYKTMPCNSTTPAPVGTR